MTTFYTSDHHFHHRNVLRFENRPFNSIEEMNEKLVEAWNETVEPEDTVRYLGDFSFGGYDKWTSILSQLNGKIEFIRGNHDKSNLVKRLYKEGYFKKLYMLGDYIKIRSPKTKNRYQLYLSHFPMEIGLRPRMFSISGHIHSTPSNLLNQVNVGVDSPLNFGRTFGKPISEEELVTYLDYINPKIEEIFQKTRKEQAIEN